MTRESTETFDKNNLDQLLLMTHAYGGKSKNIYMYIITDSADYSVPLYQRKKEKKRKKRKNKRNEINAWTVLHVIHVTQKSQISHKNNYRRLTNRSFEKFRVA